MVRASYDDFFRFATEREHVRRWKESGKKPPWTTDEVLQQYRFCNVFREDDRVTRWFREHLREPQRGAAAVLFTTVAFRWFNRISTGEAIKPYLQRYREEMKLDYRGMLATVRDLQGRGPVVTGAYVIKTPDGQTKGDGIMLCLRRFLQEHEREVLSVIGQEGTLQATHARLMEVPFLGSFMAYEVVTDLRHTDLLCDAPDTETWAAAGPGAARGLGWLFNGKPEGFRHSTVSGQEECLWHMREVLAESAVRWPEEWPRWEMREVEHVLCEYDKWMRGLLGERLKRRYHAT